MLQIVRIFIIFVILINYTKYNEIKAQFLMYNNGTNITVNGNIGITIHGGLHTSGDFAVTEVTTSDGFIDIKNAPGLPGDCLVTGPTAMFSNSGRTLIERNLILQDFTNVNQADSMLVLGDVQVQSGYLSLFGGSRTGVHKDWYVENDGAVIPFDPSALTIFKGNIVSTLFRGDLVPEWNFSLGTTVLNKTGTGYVQLQSAIPGYQDASLTTSQLVFQGGYLKTHPLSPNTNLTPQITIGEPVSNAIRGHNTVPGDAASIGHVWGQLRRFVYSTVDTDFDFPVGDGSSLQLLRLSFNNPNFWNFPVGEKIQYIDAYYSDYASISPPTEILGQCGPNTNLRGYTGAWYFEPKSDMTVTRIPSLPTGYTYRATIHPRLVDDNAGWIGGTLTPLSIFINHGEGFGNTGSGWEVVRRTDLPLTPDGYPCVSETDKNNLSTGQTLKDFSAIQGAESETNTPFPFYGLKLKLTELSNAFGLFWELDKVLKFGWFEVQRSFDGISFTTLKSVPNRTTHLVDQDLVYDKFIYYRIKYVQIDGLAFYSNIVSGKISDKAHPQHLQATIYPNPTNDKINIKLSQSFSKPLTVSFRDVTGKFLFSEEFISDSIEIDITSKNLPAGVYLVTLTAETQIVSQRVFYQK